MKDIKQELLFMIDEINVSGFFGEVDEYENSGAIEVKNKPLLAQLKLQFITGDKSFDFYDKLKAWVSVSVVIVINNNSKESKTSSCYEVRNLIANGKIDKAIEILLVLSKNTDSYNTVILLSGQYRDLERSKNMGIIDISSAGMQLARITNALLSLLRELCE